MDVKQSGMDDVRQAERDVETERNADIHRPRLSSVPRVKEKRMTL